MLRRTLGAQVENLQFVGDGLVLQLLGGFVDPLLKSGNLDFDGPPRIRGIRCDGGDAGPSTRGRGPRR